MLQKELTHRGRVTHICVSNSLSWNGDYQTDAIISSTVIWMKTIIPQMDLPGSTPCYSRKYQAYITDKNEINVYPINYVHHYSDITMDAIVSQATSLTIVYSTVSSDADQRKHQSSTSLAFVRGIHRWPVNIPHRCPVTRKMFPFDDVFMLLCNGFFHISGRLSAWKLHRAHFRFVPYQWGTVLLCDDLESGLLPRKSMTDFFNMIFRLIEMWLCNKINPNYSVWKHACRKQTKLNYNDHLMILIAYFNCIHC